MRGILQRLSRRRLSTAVAAAGILLALATTAVLSAQRDEQPTSPARVPVTTGEGRPPPVERIGSPDAAGPPEAGPGLVRTPERDVYAVAISDLVFGLDTRTSTPERLRQQLRREADPQLSEDGLHDLYATIDARVPADALWERMRRNDQWSQWQPTRTWEPAAWANVVTGGHAEPGWVMRNVTGVQTTHYVEDGRSRSTSREATLSVVMRCPVEGVDLKFCRLVLISTQPVF